MCLCTFSSMVSIRTPLINLLPGRTKGSYTVYISTRATRSPLHNSQSNEVNKQVSCTPLLSLLDDATMWEAGEWMSEVS